MIQIVFLNGTIEYNLVSSERASYIGIKLAKSLFQPEDFSNSGDEGLFMSVHGLEALCSSGQVSCIAHMGIGSDKTSKI